MSVTPETLNKINSLKQGIEAATGETYTDLTAGVQALKNGYGQGGEAKEEQEKTVEITENGTTEVVADEGKTMSKVTVNTNVAFEGDVGKPFIDSSKIANFSYLCDNNSKFMEEDLKNLDVSNGIDFANMFRSSAFKIIPPLNTVNGTNFNYMFYSCNAIEIQSINLSKTQYAESMFKYCSRLETINIVGTTDGIKSSIALEFPSSTKLKNITIPQGWKNSLYLHYSSVITVESLHGMIENLADLTGQTAKTFQIGATNLAKIDEAHINMLKAKNWNYS